METSIELWYAGVVIGRVTVSGEGEIDEGALFLPVPDPLPVGTRLNLKIDGRAAEARVLSVSESAEPGKAGMKVRIGAATGAPSATGAPGATGAPSATGAPGGPSATGAPSATDAPAAEVAPEVSDAHPADGAGDGVPTADETAGNSGAVGGGGGRRRRRRR